MQENNIQDFLLCALIQSNCVSFVLWTLYEIMLYSIHATCNTSITIRHSQTMRVLRRRLHGVESGSTAVANHRARPDGGEIRQGVRHVSDDDPGRRNDVSGQDGQDRCDDGRRPATACEQGESGSAEVTYKQLVKKYVCFRLKVS